MAHLINAERQTRSAADPATQQLHGIGQEHAQKLEARLSTMTLSLAKQNHVGDLQISRNGESVDLGTLNRTLPIDGETYVIGARAPGKVDWVDDSDSWCRA